MEWPRGPRFAEHQHVDRGNTVNFISDDENDDDDGDMERVSHPDYRNHHLDQSRIMFRHPHDQLPDAVATHLDHMASIMRQMPELSPEVVVEAVYELERLEGYAGLDGHVPNYCYSLAIDNNVAQLYIAWGVKEDGVRGTLYASTSGWQPSSIGDKEHA
ncbi:hypothetical protein B0T26DRAFT_680917 [Lasiosphaeria miniovina]|uniref:Uncharacterized protein n=1 Tax=Lasiosphaeria miniovina TaxID=1954250 RepID=A0AA39ZTF6_9PEZI|nr:uncharacterized protein B0T26DRAFT_680917 [Lasiosphaeria miniovina]KAK0703194.1 hypothetical protein B0T26DRAFT_680917 [Lasiosphaeria miniovina]